MVVTTVDCEICEVSKRTSSRSPNSRQNVVSISTDTDLEHDPDPDRSERRRPVTVCMPFGVISCFAIPFRITGVVISYIAT